MGSWATVPINKYGFANQQLSKTALGAEQFVEWEKIGSSGIPMTKVTDQTELNKPALTKPTLDLINNIKSNGFNIISIEQAKSSISYYKYNPTKKQLNTTALVLGPEVVGLPKSILKQSDHIIEIPMHGQKNSLNVSVSFGIVVYSLIAK